MKQVRVKISWDHDILVPADMFADFFEILRCCRLVQTAYNQPDKLIIDPLEMRLENEHDEVRNPAGDDSLAAETSTTAQEKGQETK